MLLQEGSTVSWDPMYEGGGSFSVEAAAGLLLLCVAVVVYWTALKWIIAHCPNRPGWRATRYWFPTAMMMGGLLVAWIAEAGHGRLSDGVAAMCALLNLPALIGGGMVAELSDLAGASGWPVGLAAIVVGWATWYAVIRWIEVRREETAPLTLNLGRPGGLPYEH